MAGHSRSKNGVASLAYVPAIHVLLVGLLQGVDARDKRGHDESQTIGSRIGSWRTERRKARENSEISTGSVIRITIGASIMPPTTTTASGFCTCDPMPDDIAAGRRPTPAMMQVIITGRICSSPVRGTAVVRSTPARMS